MWVQTLPGPMQFQCNFTMFSTEWSQYTDSRVNYTSYQLISQLSQNKLVQTKKLPINDLVKSSFTEFGLVNSSKKERFFLSNFHMSWLCWSKPGRSRGIDFGVTGFTVNTEKIFDMTRPKQTSQWQKGHTIDSDVYIISLSNLVCLRIHQ